MHLLLNPVKTYHHTVLEVYVFGRVILSQYKIIKKNNVWICDITLISSHNFIA